MDLRTESATHPSPTEQEAAWASPQVSNMIFLGGVVLCLLGLLMLVVASIMISRAIAHNKQARLLRGLDPLPDSSPFIPPSVGSGPVRVPGDSAQDAMELEQSFLGREEYPSSPTTVMRMDSSQTSPSDLDLHKLGPPPEVVTPSLHAATNDVAPAAPTSPPPPCLPNNTAPYACNPIPSPEATVHYDTFERQAERYDGPQVGGYTPPAPYPGAMNLSPAPRCRPRMAGDRTPPPPPPLEPATMAPPPGQYEDRYQPAPGEAQFSPDHQPFINHGLGYEASLTRTQRM